MLIVVIAVIQKMVEKLQVTQKDHIAAYGEGNKRRLTRMLTFCWGVANCGASVKVGGGTE